MANKPSYTLTCSVPTDDKDILIARWSLLDLQGCEERETGDSTLLTAYFADRKTAGEAQKVIRDARQRANAQIAVVQQQDWNARWRKSMKPALLAPGWWVSPQWLRPKMRRSDRWIRIEPKMAFGTGHHETTRLAAQAIIKTAAGRKSFKRMLDIGTGSGVLCLVGDICGVARCTGVEIDRDCRENLAENLADNKPNGRVSFIISNGDAVKKGARFDLVVMNMIFTESAPHLARVRSMLAPRGKLVWSGILADGRGEAVTAARKHGFVLTDETTENEWWCGVFWGRR